MLTQKDHPKTPDPAWPSPRISPVTHPFEDIDGLLVVGDPAQQVKRVMASWIGITARPWTGLSSTLTRPAVRVRPPPERRQDNGQVGDGLVLGDAGRLRHVRGAVFDESVKRLLAGEGSVRIAPGAVLLQLRTVSLGAVIRFLAQGKATTLAAGLRGISRSRVTGTSSAAARSLHMSTPGVVAPVSHLDTAWRVTKTFPAVALRHALSFPGRADGLADTQCCSLASVALSMATFLRETHPCSGVEQHFVAPEILRRRTHHQGAGHRTAHSCRHGGGPRPGAVSAVRHPRGGAAGPRVRGEYRVPREKRPPPR